MRDLLDGNKKIVIDGWSCYTHGVVEREAYLMVRDSVAHSEKWRCVEIAAIAFRHVESQLSTDTMVLVPVFCTACENGS